MKTVTMSDIAARAGLSRKSVYGILNNKDDIRVSDTAREKVMTLVKELNYAPNHFARSLKTGKTNIIGITSGMGVPIRQMFNDPYFSNLYTGIGYGAADRGYRVLFQHNQDGSYYGSMEMALTNMVDGIIFVLLSEWVDDFRELQLPRLRKLGIPFTVIVTFAGEFDAPGVGVDARQGAFDAVAHLLEHGYRSLGFLHYGGMGGLYNVALSDGFSSALNQYGIDPGQALRLQSDGMDAAAGYRVLDRYISEGGNMPRAWFSTQVRVAEGAVKRLHEAGIRAPEDCAVAAYGIELSDADVMSTMTVARPPVVEAGRKAAEMLFAQMDGEKPCSVLLMPELVVRKSCGCK